MRKFGIMIAAASVALAVTPASAANLVINLGGYYATSHTVFTQGQPSYTVGSGQAKNIGNAQTITFANINNWFANPTGPDQSGIPVSGQFIQMDTGGKTETGVLDLTTTTPSWEKEWTAGGKWYEEEFTSYNSITRAPTSLTIDMVGTLSIWNNCTTDPSGGSCGNASTTGQAVDLTLQINQQLKPGTQVGFGAISNSFTDITLSAPGPGPAVGLFGLASVATLLLAARARASRI